MKYMLQRMLIWTFFMSISPFLPAQQDSSIYVNIETRKYYSVDYSISVRNDITTYRINDREVSRETYEKYSNAERVLDSCCPCLLQAYDENDVLTRERISCGSCGVGWFREFYPNGTVQLSGRYKENPTGNWKDLWQRGYCEIREGQWVYFTEQGDTLYSEFWQDNRFIRQAPEQNITEIWDAGITFMGQDADGMTLTATEVQQLVITPRFKNSTRDSLDDIVRIEATTMGRKPYIQSFTLSGFKDIDVAAMYKAAGIWSPSPTLTITVYNREKRIREIRIQIQAK